MPLLAVAIRFRPLPDVGVTPSRCCDPDEAEEASIVDKPEITTVLTLRLLLPLTLLLWLLARLRPLPALPLLHTDPALTFLRLRLCIVVGTAASSPRVIIPPGALAAARLPVVLDV